jgi:alanine-synthesizing transaminase
MKTFTRLNRLPPYVFATVNQIKMEARRAGEDIIDLGMGNPDLATPKHIVDKLIEAAQKPQNHRYSASMGIRKLGWLSPTGTSGDMTWISTRRPKPL